MNLPNMKKPCKDCPFLTSATKGWLGKERMESILNSDSFVCHKQNALQCAGHMLVSDNNGFLVLAGRLGIKLKLTGKDMVFENERDCIEHHT